jgi:diacylglycerol kinase family enzyme
VTSSNSATLIVSPLASRIRAPATRAWIVERTIAALHARGVGEVRVIEASTPASVRAAATQAVASRSSIVALLGGDGTVRDATGTLAGTGVQVGIVPCGTGNLYASSVGVPRNLTQAIGNLTRGSVQPFDLGSVQVGPGSDKGDPAERPTESFTVACGTGFDARVIAATTAEAKRRYGVAAYFMSAIRMREHLTPRPTIITIDGARSEIEAFVILIANCGEAIPGLLRPRLPMDPRDGLLHVFVLPRGGLVGGILGAFELLTTDTLGTSRSGSAIRLTGHHVRVEVDPAQPTQVDGDAYADGSLETWIRPGALSVLVP